MWLVFALSGPVLWAVSTHIDKFLVDKYFRDSDTAVLMVFTAFIGVAALPVIWAFDPQVMALSATAIGVMTLSGILYMGAMLFYLRAIQREEASVVAPLFQANTLFTFALGTSAGDLVAERFEFGYLTTGFIFGGLIAIIAVAYYLFRLNGILAFWLAYIFTRPLGASFGDLLAQPTEYGGLGFGTTMTSLLFLGAIVLIVVYMTISRRTEDDIAASDEVPVPEPEKP